MRSSTKKSSSSTVPGAEAENRERLQESVEIADARIRTLLESFADAFYAVDSDWRFVYLNPKAEELLQRSRLDLIGKNVWAEFPEAVDTPLYAEFQRAIRSKQPVRTEAYYAPFAAWFEAYAYPSEAGLSVYLHDVTERKQAAEALRASEGRFRAVWEASADGMALSDPDGTVIAVNRAYVELYGYPEEEVVGQNFAVIFPEEGREWANNLYRETFNDPAKPPTFESVIRRKDGTQRVVESRVDFVEKDGQRVAMLSSIRDITERIRHEEALRESEERFRQTFDGAPIGLALVGLDFKPFRANAALCKFLGYSEEELTQLTATELTYPEDVAADLELATQLLGGEIPSYQIEKRYVTRSGDIVWAQLSVALIRDAAGSILYALSMLEDITQRKRAEEERLRLLAQEQAARELAERAVRAQEELLSLVSHDLNNPIAVIKGVTQLMQRRIARGNAPDLAQLAATMTKLAEAADKMEAFVHDLSTPQHIQPGRLLRITPERLDLVALTRRVADTHQQRTEDHQIVVESGLSELIGRWDPARLEQVLDNLLTNAVKYSPKGGRVRIGIGYEEVPPDAIPIDEGEARNLGLCAVVTVRDNGLGIPAGDLPYIFEWYRRGSNVRDKINGTGVGLAGARQIVEQHGGRISVESQEGAGSTFTVVLPLDSPAFDAE
ncbi:MAG TPA: PAS domain S-box protein [Chloroflexia bacterium]|jgi:PAS domain S-box-containing protein